MRRSPATIGRALTIEQISAEALRSALGTPRCNRARHYSLISFAQGSSMRSRCVPKSTRMTCSSSRLTTLPRPYLSCVTKSPTANVSTGSSTTGTLKGLPGSWRLAGRARDGFTSSQYSARLCRRTPLRPAASPVGQGSSEQSAWSGTVAGGLREQLRRSRSGAPVVHRSDERAGFHLRGGPLEMRPPRSGRRHS